MKITIGQLPSVLASPHGGSRLDAKNNRTMRKLRTVFTIVAVLALVSTSTSAGKVKVIANSSVKTDSISAEELKSVFLEQTSLLSDGSHVEPVLVKGGPAHHAFVRDYLGKSDVALQTYYRSLVFTGKGSMPKMVGSDSEMAAYVAKTRGAIGYISAETDTAGAKTLQVK